VTSPLTVTVITIGRNSLHGLEETRASVRSQTYSHLDHLLIDGASTDGSAEAVMTMAEQERTRAVSRPDRGIYDAMNSALELVDTDYLIFLHAGDSFVDSDAVSRAMAAITAEPARPDIAVGWSRFVSNGQPLPFVVGGETPNALTSAHESCFFSLDFHKHERYNTNLQLAADYEFFRDLATRPGVAVLRLPYTISNFAFGGRSNNPAFDGPRFLERARIDASFGDDPSMTSYLRIATRMATRKAVYGLLGAHRAAQVFLRLACRRGNSGAQQLPVGQVWL